VNVGEFLRSSVRSLLDGLERRIALEAGQPTRGVQWLPAVPALAQIIDAESTASIEQDSRPIWMSEALIGQTGVMRVRNARVLSMARRNAGFFVNSDPHAREVASLTAHGRPINVGRPPSVLNRLPKLLRNLAAGGALRPAVKATRQHGSVAVVTAYYGDCNNYYHFWTDAVADLWFLERMGFGPSAIDKYLMPYGRYDWQRQVLEMCGIPESKVLAAADVAHLRIDDLILPVRPKGGLKSPSWLAQGLREQTGWEPADGAGRRRIYVSRLDAQRRRLVNELDVIRFLSERGFEIHECSSLSVREQQRLFDSASTIIAPHGAALTNIVWCRPDTELLEFLSAKHLNPCFRDLASAAGLHYSALVCSPADPSKHGLTGDIVVSMEALERYLARLAEPTDCG
jgi:capsular polysaccharide biosynthesis protein